MRRILHDACQHFGDYGGCLRPFHGRANFGFLFLIVILAGICRWYLPCSTICRHRLYSAAAGSRTLHQARGCATTATFVVIDGVMRCPCQSASRRAGRADLLRFYILTHLYILCIFEYSVTNVYLFYHRLRPYRFHLCIRRFRTSHFTPA